MRTLKLTIFLLIFSLIACKKENNYPIIKPGSYFPVYPNSYWKYLVNDSIVSMDSTSDNYVLNNTWISSSYDNEYTELVYVPYYNCGNNSPIGYNGPIYKYGRYIYNILHPTQIWPFLSETIGFSFLRSPDSQYPKDNEQVTVKAKIFNGQDSVLIIVGSYFWGTSSPDHTYPIKRYQEWVKDVGLFRDIIYDTITNDTISKRILIDYYISKEL